MKRRSFLGSLVGGASLSAAGCAAAPDYTGPAQFNHGVASGDPETNRVIIWTRVSGVSADEVDVVWQVATDRAMQRIVNEGSFRTGAHRDFTVKVDADNLPAGQRLYYQFAVGSHLSPVGRTRTLPQDSPDKASFAVVSCSNHPYGYFHAYREIAHRDNLDAVIHLGDYIYEYGVGEYATEYAEHLGRIPEPAHRLLSLADYRQRHAQYKADIDAQVMHAAHPLIAIWDDHELANDAWQGGAENHKPDDGDWGARRNAAIQAWLEWMPVRAAHEQAETRIFREYRYADLLTLIMLDTRLIGRDLQPDAGADVTMESIQAAMQDPNRQLLGAAQQEWLETQLREAAGTTWQLIGQQVMVSPTRSPELEPLLDLEREAALPRETLEGIVEMSKGNPPMLLDTWNGYPAAREAFLATLGRLAANAVVLSGDLHTPLAGNLVPHGADEPVAVELMTGSVTSPGFAEYLPERSPNAVRDATLAVNPSLVYMDTAHRGWMTVDLTHDELRARWYLLDTVHQRDYQAHEDFSVRIKAGHIADGLLT